MTGITFIEPLLIKTISGLKTQTRRLVHKDENPKYTVGEIVFIQEPYIEIDGNTLYKYGVKTDKEVFRNSPQLVKAIGNNTVDWNDEKTMVEKNARYFIEIISVRCEKLIQISHRECICEGINKIDTAYVKYYTHDLENNRHYRSSIEAFAAMWNMIYPANPFLSNPDVYIYEYKLKKI